MNYPLIQQTKKMTDRMHFKTSLAVLRVIVVPPSRLEMGMTMEKNLIQHGLPLDQGARTTPYLKMIVKLKAPLWEMTLTQETEMMEVEAVIIKVEIQLQEPVTRSTKKTRTRAKGLEMKMDGL